MDRSRRSLVRRWRSLGLLGIIALSLLQQSCLAVAWIAAVGTDSMRTSEVTFQPFEQSWVSVEAPTDIIESPMLTSLAVLPVDGDEEMGQRLTHILQHQTALRIEPSNKFEPGIAVMQQDDGGRAARAREIALDLSVDAVLFGHVASAISHPSEWGWKEEASRRLFLYLVDRDGHLLWKDELPFIVVTGSKPPLEESVQTSLSHHFMDHVHALGLDTIGYLPRKSS